MPKLYKKLEAFSLIEILIVVALIIILATITIVAINPAKNFRDTRNAQRSSDVTAILNAVTQYTSEEGNALTLPACDTATAAEMEIGATGGVDLTTPLVEEYIVEIPVDPSETGEGTGYAICQTAGGRVQVDAPLAEFPDDATRTITVKR